MVSWAAQRAGLIYTAISRYLKADEIAYIVRDCGAKAFIASAACVAEAQGLATAAKAPALFMTGGAAPGFRDWDAEIAAAPETPVENEFAGRDMLYSSGTTGRPKGVETLLTPVPHGRLNPLLKLLCVDICGVNQDSVYLSPAPLYHAAPLRFTMTAVAMGATVVVMKSFDAGALSATDRAAPRDAQPTRADDVRAPVEAAAGDARPIRHQSLKSAIHAAAPCPVEIKQQMIDWWGPILVEYYAGTEGNGVTIITSRRMARRIAARSDAPSSARSGSSMRRRAARCRRARSASIYFEDGPPFAYRNDPAKTRAAYSREGWSTLGDIGYLDEEGYLYLTDRKAHMIISGGVNVYPQEAEDVLLGHPAVLDAAVFGVPSEDLGEEVKAVVQLRDPARG